tara:strand:- start:3322 stop:4725 length:1404 start_codon:yes stop_codon:yes gene_type:complete
VIKLVKYLFIIIVYQICSFSAYADTHMSGGKTTNFVKNKNSYSLPARNLDKNLRINFLVGNSLFRRIWEDAATSENIAKDGLGPFFSSTSCDGCHISDGRGHLPILEIDEDLISAVIQIGQPTKIENTNEKNHNDSTYGGQLSEFSTEDVLEEAQISIEYEFMNVAYDDGTIVQLKKPKVIIDKLNYGDLEPNTSSSIRIAQVMIGLGLIENIAEEDILKLQDIDDSNSDGISGKANVTWDMQESKFKIGRFGWKASQPTVLQQTADAFYHDMGLSNKFYPNASNCTETQLDCNNSVSGNSEIYDNFEVSNDQLDLVTFYSSQLGVPAARNQKKADVIAGKKIFYEVGCNSCHVERHITRSDGPFENLNNQIISPYSDFLLHDMGDGLSDQVPEFEAEGNEWRTPPLWGIGLTKIVSGRESYLHDGRAESLEEAILWHGGESLESKNKFKNLDINQRNQLLKFISSL